MCDALEALLYNLSVLIYGDPMNATAITVSCDCTTAQWKTGIPQALVTLFYVAVLFTFCFQVVVS